MARAVKKPQIKLRCRCPPTCCRLSNWLPSYFIIPHVKVVSRDWLTQVNHSIMSTGEMSTDKTSTVLTGTTGSHCLFDVLPNSGLFGIIKQICNFKIITNYSLSLHTTNYIYDLLIRRNSILKHIRNFP